MNRQIVFISLILYFSGICTDYLYEYQGAGSLTFCCFALEGNEKLSSRLKVLRNQIFNDQIP